MSRPRISVIIPTLGRPELVVQALRDLEKQDTDSWQTLVIEQGERSREIEDYIARHSRFSYFFQQQPNTSRAKNLGVEKSSGSIIVFLDDDVRLPEDFLSHYERVLNKNKNVGAVAAKIKQPSDPLPVGKEGEVGKVSLYGRFTDNFGSSTKTRIQTVHGCSAYRREAFEKAGGFDGNFVGNAMREESDLSFRVRDAGYILVFDPENYFIHLKAPRGGTRAKTDRMDWYADFFHNDLYFFLKHGKIRWIPVFFISKIRPILACGFYYGKGRPKAIALPFRSYYAGYKTYKKSKVKS